MKAVLKNDWYAVRNPLLILLLISVFSSWLKTLSPEESFASPLLYSAFLPPALYMIDERSKWGRFASALPGKRGDYIHSKYTSVGVSLLAVLAVTGICELIIAAKAQQSALILAFSAALVMCSILLPFTTAFGSKAGVAAFFVTITLCGVVVGYSDAMIEDGKASPPSLPQSLIFLLAAVITYGLSWLVSLQIYKRKEL